MVIDGWKFETWSTFDNSHEIDYPLLGLDFWTHLQVPKRYKKPKWKVNSSLDWTRNRQLRRSIEFSIILFRRKYALSVDKVYRTYTREELLIES